MSKRSVFTTVTALPAGISRETVIETLHCHTEMIDLNPLVTERHQIKPPSNATPEEYHCIWYSITDKVQYLPGGMASGSVSYNGCFHDLPNGLQTHVYAPMGLNIKGKWTLGGSLPGEPVQPVELGLGAPITGLYLREDVDMRCNVVLTSFVKKTLKKSHGQLVDRLMVKAQILEGSAHNSRLYEEKTLRTASFVKSQSSMTYPESSIDSESTYEDSMGGNNGAPSPHYIAYSADSQHSSSFEIPGSQNQHFRAPDHPEFRDKSTFDPSLVPQPLGVGIRSSSSSYQSSMNDNQNGRASCNGPIGNAGSQNNPRTISWQNLNASTTRQSPQYHGMDPAYQQANPYSGGRDSRQGTQGQPHPQIAELPSGKKEDHEEEVAHGRNSNIKTARAKREVHEMA